MKLTTRFKLLNKLRNVPREGWNWQNILDLVDSLWRDHQKPVTINPASAALASIDANQVLTIAPDTAIKVAIDFIDAGELEFIYNCPVPLKFTSQESEGADAAISPALNTDLAQYDKVTITAAEVGLIVLNGETL